MINYELQIILIRQENYCRESTYVCIRRLGSVKHQLNFFKKVNASSVFRSEKICSDV